MNNTLLTVKEVAIRFGVSTTAVYDWIRKGSLRCVLIGRIAQRKYIPLESVEAFEAERLRGSESDSDNGWGSPHVAAA